MKLSDYARKIGISYRTAWRWYKSGQLKGYQAETGTIIITEPLPDVITPAPKKVAIYSYLFYGQLFHAIRRFVVGELTGVNWAD